MSHQDRQGRPQGGQQQGGYETTRRQSQSDHGDWGGWRAGQDDEYRPGGYGGWDQDRGERFGAMEHGRTDRLGGVGNPSRQDYGNWGPQADGRGTEQHSEFDPDYLQWRNQQMRGLDDDYRSWRQDRFKKFSDDFATWRGQRKTPMSESGSDAASGEASATGSASRGSGSKTVTSK